MKAIKITTNDAKRVVNIKDLKGMQKHVGGNIQVVRSYFLNDLVVPANSSLLMIVNEDGKNVGLENVQTQRKKLKGKLNKRAKEEIGG